MSASETPTLRPHELAYDDPLDVDQIYRRHGNWLIAYLRRRFGPEDADDLAQDTYLRAIHSAAKIRDPRPFLIQVAATAARDRARRRAVRPVLIASNARMESASTEPVQVEALLLKQVIKAMPPKIREVFLLSRSAGLTYEEIARRCGISVKRVEARMTQALAMCSALTE